MSNAAPRSPARRRGGRKAVRDIFQAVLAVLAAGGATAIIDLVIGSINSFAVGTALAFVFKILIAYAQNYMETKGSIPTLLPTPGLITEAPERMITRTVGTLGDAAGRTGGAVTDTVTQVAEEGKGAVEQTVGTMTTVMTEAGDVVSAVTDSAGEVVGEMTSAVGGVGGLLGKGAGDNDDDDDDDAEYTKEFDH